MKIISDYFERFKENIIFIDTDKIADIRLEEKIPIPLVENKNIENINISEIIKGFIYLIGIEKEENLYKRYIKILKNYDEDIEEYILFKGLGFLDQEEINISNIYFRALYRINSKNILALFNYALALERISIELQEADPIKAKAFIDGSTELFESILDLDEDYSLAYYKLGYHYKYNGQNLKAKLMWEKFLKIDDDENRLDEIRNQIYDMEDKINLESALTYISYNRYDEALNYLNKLLPKHEKWWELNYLIGLCHAQLGYNHQAIEYYYKALEYNSDVEDVYNELAIELFKINEINEAIKIYSLAIESLESNYKFYYNRALAYIQLEEFEKAKADIKMAYELNPIDGNVEELFNKLIK